jgi:hypothetical protein
MMQMTYQLAQIRVDELLEAADRRRLARQVATDKGAVRRRPGRRPSRRRIPLFQRSSLIHG